MAPRELVIKQQNLAISQGEPPKCAIFKAFYTIFRDLADSGCYGANQQ